MTQYPYKNGRPVQIAGAKEKLCASGRVAEQEHTTSETGCIYVAVAVAQAKRDVHIVVDKAGKILQFTDKQ